MRRVLNADFHKLWKDKVFRIAVALMFVIGAVMPVLHYINIVRTGYELPLESGFFIYTVIMAIIAAVVSALFTGTEYSDGTIRNRLVVGHSRSSIYFSNLIVCITSGLIMCAAYILPYVTIGSCLEGFFRCGIKPIAVIVLVSLAAMIAFIAFFTAIAQLVPNKAYSAVASILLAGVLLIAGVYINSSLNEPKYYDAYSYTQNGVTQTEEAEANPNYLSGTKRQVYEFLYDFLPGCQVVQFVGMEVNSPKMLALYDFVLAAAAAGCGIIVFRRKDLK